MFPGLGNSIATTLGDFVFPPTCAWCFNTIENRERIALRRLCERCEQLLAPAAEHVCPRCAAVVGPYVANRQGCPSCRNENYAFESAVALGAYTGELQKACLRCKRTGDPYLGVALTGLLWDRARPTLESWNVDVIVPVPHHWLDRALRRFHLADVAADWLGRFLMVPCERHILAKRKWTPKQLTLSQSARRRNLQSAFRVAGGSRLKGMRVMLVDDILTTGTTVHRASRELRGAGASEVVVAVLARGVGN